MHSRRPSRRMWGSLATVDGEGYLDAVDKSPADTVVVVYIYDDCSDVSTAIEACLRQLARRHMDTRFVKLHYVDAEMEPAGIPALLAYRGGEKFAGLVPIINEIPDDADLSDTTLENMLRRWDILALVDMRERTSDTAITRTSASCVRFTTLTVHATTSTPATFGSHYLTSLPSTKRPTH
ncbi:hypothetical protein LTR87_012560 [Friedmanniomyces endolithicus]|nr:hypothetical protein LTR87_012560 [Friedmanniomyces endolithicus]